jgi:DNA-directed RNA polymerase specialized sigma24 family protein
MESHQIDAARFLKLCIVAVLKFLRHFGVNSWELGDEEAGTLAEDVFMKLWGNETIEDPCRAVWAAARNTVIDALRRAGRHPRFSLNDNNTHETRFEPSGHGSRRGELSAIEVSELLDEVVKAIPPGEGRIVRFCRETGVEFGDSTEIARNLGMKPAAVSQSKRRTVRRAQSMRPQVEELEGR